MDAWAAKYGQSVAFVDDDRYLLTSVPTGPVLVYALDAEELIDIARARVRRGFTPSECDTYFADRSCPTIENLRAG